MRSLLLVFLLLATSAFGQIGGLNVIKWRVYKSDVASAITGESTFVINNQAEFQRYWAKSTGKDASTAPSDVKWGEEMLIAVHLGNKPSTGYSVYVKSIERPRASSILVTYCERKPVPGAFNAQVITSPYEIVRMERMGGNIEFKKQTASGSGVISIGGVAWSTYACDTDCLLKRETTVAIRNQAECEAFWKTAFKDRPPVDIDWDNDMLVFVGQGTVATSGYEALVTSVESDGHDLGIIWLDRRPSKNQRVKSGASSPFCIARVPRCDGKVYFDRRVWDSSGG